MTIPASSTSLANALARQDSAGKLAAGMGGVASTLATLDTNTALVEPAQKVRAFVPSASGQLGIDSGDLKFHDGTAARIMENQSRRNANSGYAGLDAGGKVAAAQLPTLDVIPAPALDVSLNSKKITNLAAPTSANDAVTKAYADAISAGLTEFKSSVACATTANISLSGEQTLDGVTTSTSRVLVKDQTTASQNGIYVSAAGAWARASDMDASAEVGVGTYVLVDAGTTLQRTAWVVSVAPATLGTDTMTWVQFSGINDVVAGSGLTQSSGVMAVGAGNGVIVNANDVALDYGTTSELVNVTKAAEAAGTSNKVARADHKHDIDTAAPGAAGVGTASGEGTSTSLARADHSHQSNTAASPLTGAGVSGTIGTSTEPARADHQHQHPVYAGGDMHTEYAKADGSRAFTARISTAGQKYKVRTLTGTAGVVDNSDDIIRLNGASAACDVALPDATAAANLNMRVKIMAIDVTNTVRVVPNGTDQINGVNAAKTILSQYESMEFVVGASGKWEIW